MAQVLGIELIRWVEAAIVILATYIVAKLLSNFLAGFFRRISLAEKGGKNIVRFLKYVAYIVGAVGVITVLGFDPTDVIVGLGVFSIALGFALSTVIHNLVSGIIVQMDKNFKVGDEIGVSVFEGTIMKISVRTTVLETKDGETVFVPNSFFITNPIVKKRSQKPKSEQTTIVRQN